MKDTEIKIPAELFALAESSHFEGEYELRLLVAGPDDYTFTGKLPWEVEVTNTGSALLVAGSVSGEGVCACSRCLEDVPHQFNGVVEGYFLIEGGERAFGDDEDMPGEDEFDVLPENHVIDLAPLLKSALMVDAPEMPLCKEDCKGLCQQCGANLNEGDCGCGADEALGEFAREANPFSALAGFKFE